MSNRNAMGRFEKGCSGNPTGRPKRSDAELELIQNLSSLSDAAFRTIKDLLENETTPANIRFRAAELVILRVAGKPTTPEELYDYETRPRIDASSPIVQILAEALTGGN